MTHLKKLTDNNGFSLVEMMVCIVIISIVFYGIYNFMYYHIFLANDEARKAQLNQQARGALDKIVDEMRMANDGDQEDISAGIYKGIYIYRDDFATEIDKIAGNVGALENAGNIIRIRYIGPATAAYPAGEPVDVCYRIDNSNTTNKGAFVRFKKSDSTNGEVPSNAYTVIESKGNGAGIVNPFKSLTNFEVRVGPSNNGDKNYRNYTLSMSVQEGPGAMNGPKKIKVTVNTDLVKNKMSNKLH